MSKKFVKANLAMILILSVAGAIALALAVFICIVLVDWYGYSERTEKARDSIRKLVNQKPSPSKENLERIEEDIEVYKKAAEGLRSQFKSPLQPALDVFFKVLQPPRRVAFEIRDGNGNVDTEQTEAQIAKYTASQENFLAFLQKKYGSVEALNKAWKTAKPFGDFSEVKLPTAAQIKKPDPNDAAAQDFIIAFGSDAVPGQIRRLTQAEFTEFFRTKFDRYCEQNGKDESVKYNLTTLNEYISRNSGDFPAGNWNRAVNAFAQAAQKLTCEPVNNYNNVAVIVSSLGLRRRVGEDLNSVCAHVDDTIETIKKRAQELKLDLFPLALDFVGGDSKSAPLPLEDYGMALFQWDVFGDIVIRLGQAKVKSLHRIVLRSGSSSDENPVRNSERPQVNLKECFKTVGDDNSFRIYHYTVVFSGSMESIRAALRCIDEANKDNRTYVVRSICLYAKENGAGLIMDPGNSLSRDGRGADDSDEPVVRRRRRGGIQLEPERRESSTRDDEVKRQIAEREAALPPHQRSDYGMILIGGESECIAFLDIDYVVLEQNQ